MISVVIPLLDEAESLEILHREISEVVVVAGLDVEIIFVDDGSRDGSWSRIQCMAERDRRVSGVRLRRNFGKAAALVAGLQQAGGETVLTLDADLQDNPSEMPALLAELAKGNDVVSGWKRTRHDPWHKVLASRLFNVMVSWLTRVHLHDHNCGMKAYRAGIFKEIHIYGELHRFIPVLAAARGFRIAEVEVQHRPRRFGHSKYGTGRFLKGFLDLLTVKFLTGYGRRPQHLLGGIGIVAFLAGLAGMAYLAVTWVVRLWHQEAFPPLHERPLLVYSVAALVLGAQMFSIGLLAELITAYQRAEEPFSIAERTPSSPEPN